MADKTWEDHILDRVAGWTGAEKNKLLQQFTGIDDLELEFDESETRLRQKYLASKAQFEADDRNALKDVAAALEKLDKTENPD
jgi:hypothetical protein